jgi:hypothetical protein
MSAKNEHVRPTAEALIADLLAEREHPSTQDWKRLIDAHPEYASEFADAAFACRSIKRLVPADLDESVPSAYANILSFAINALHHEPSPPLVALEGALAELKGAALSSLAEEVGLGSHVELLISVLDGTIRSPLRLTRALAERFHTSMAALLELFTIHFENREAPAFKAETGKPHLEFEPIPWEEAVRKTGAPQKEIEELLALDR